MGARRRDPELERFWRKAIRDRAKSGQSVREFCLSLGVSVASFYGWRKEIAKRDGAGVEPSPAATFVPVRVFNAAVVEVVLVSGVIVRVPALVDPLTVARLVAALEVTLC